MIEISGLAALNLYVFFRRKLNLSKQAVVQASSGAPTTLHWHWMAALTSTGMALFFHYLHRKLKYAHSSKSERTGFTPSRPVNEGLAVLHSDVSKGAFYCGAIALFLCLLLNASEFKSYVPILFLFVVLAIARRYGAVAGSLGTAISALLFAALLFEPFRSFAVSNLQARMNLGWMFVGGLAISNFLGRSKTPSDNKTID